MRTFRRIYFRVSLISLVVLGVVFPVGNLLGGAALVGVYVFVGLALYWGLLTAVVSVVVLASAGVRVTLRN